VKIFLSALVQVALSLLDLIGVAAIGILGALAVTGIQSQVPGNRVNRVLNLLGMGNLDFQVQVAFLGASAAIILIFRTILSIIITRRMLSFLGKQGVIIGQGLTSKMLAQNLSSIQANSSQENLYAVTAGISAATLGVVGTSVSLLSDGALLVVMLIGLLVVDPLVAISTLLLFGGLGFTLHKLMSVRSENLGRKNAELSVLLNERILEALGSYRESVVRDRRFQYLTQITKVRSEISETLAELQFLPNISKYIIESSIVIGSVAIAGIQFAVQDAKHAVATLAVFMAAGTRIAPAILRVQQNLMQLSSGVGAAEPTLQMIDRLASSTELRANIENIEFDHVGFLADIQMRDVSITYAGRDSASLDQISLDISPGSAVALVGPSGAGKTTFVDVLLGIIPPDRGSIQISGESPLNAIARWPGAVSYVPQNIYVANTTIRENVCLGFPSGFFTDSQILDAINYAQLTVFVNSLKDGIDTQVGDFGANLSGGQRQRLGIARAMITSPKLLVLDEATSALDGQTEADFSSAVASLKGKVTVILIAHRLSTIKNADHIIYMDKGKIVCSGPLDYIKASVPDFAKQAELEGI
jgi:ABC-type multidrug transport system fused ATPase/permease subunit